MSVDYNFKVIRNAKVEVSIKPVKSDVYTLQIVINGDYVHQFPPNAKENKLIYLMEPSAIAAKFTGGTYVFLDDVLIDYRTGDYTGFIHNADGIKNLAEKIGCSTTKKSAFGSPVRGLFQGFRETKGEVFLGGEGEEFDLDIAFLAEGGSFRNRLIHKWSPFSSNIITSLEVERLICNNGMVGLSPFVTNKIPIINDWERNLKIVSTGLIPTYNDILNHRFSEMANSNASIHEVLSARELLDSRKENVNIEDFFNGKKQPSKNNNDLKMLLEHLNVYKRLGDIYNEEVFIDKDKSKMVASDLSLFDVFNILTEGCTHTSGSDSSNGMIQREINRIVFDELHNKRKALAEVPKLSEESDHKRIFFGKG